MGGHTKPFKFFAVLNPAHEDQQQLIFQLFYFDIRYKSFIVKRYDAASINEHYDPVSSNYPRTQVFANDNIKASPALTATNDWGDFVSQVHNPTESHHSSSITAADNVDNDWDLFASEVHEQQQTVIRDSPTTSIQPEAQSSDQSLATSFVDDQDVQQSMVRQDRKNRVFYVVYIQKLKLRQQTFYFVSY